MQTRLDSDVSEFRLEGLGFRSLGSSGFGNFELE